MEQSDSNPKMAIDINMTSINLMMENLGIDMNDMDIAQSNLKPEMISMGMNMQKPEMVSFGMNMQKPEMVSMGMNMNKPQMISFGMNMQKPEMVSIKKNISETQMEENRQDMKPHINYRNIDDIGSESEEEQDKILLVFDFDNTIVDLDTDLNLLNLLSDKKLPQEILDQKRKDKKNWIKYMNLVFKYLRDQGITESQIRTLHESSPLSPGFLQLFQYLNENKQYFDVIIISNANSVPIDLIIQKYQIQVDKIFTNPGQFENGLLSIKPHHSHNSQCPPNLCKQTVLKIYINHQHIVSKGKFSNIIYVGDGANDFCPLKALKENDIGFVRKGFELDQLLSISENKKQVKAQLKLYQNGQEILEEITKLQKLIQQK